MRVISVQEIYSFYLKMCNRSFFYDFQTFHFAIYDLRTKTLTVEKCKIIALFKLCKKNEEKNKRK